MSSVKRFEDLECWQLGKLLVKTIYRITPGKIFRDLSLKDQIRRAAVSVISNIAEGFERGTKEEFIYFLYVAKGSSGEVRAQLYIAFDLGFINNNDFNEACELAKRVSVLIYYLIQSLKASSFKGLKYKQVKTESAHEKFMKDLEIKFPQLHTSPAKKV